MKGKLRRMLFTPILVLAVVGGTALPAYSAPADVIKIKASGSTADAFFTTVNWPPTPGEEHWSGYVLGAEEATPDTDNEPLAYAYFYAYRHIYTETGDEVILSETWGEGWGTDVSLQQDQSLKGASLTATVDTQTCPSGSEDCEPGTGTISMDWTGEGETIRGVQHDKVSTPTYTMVRNARGVERGGWATGTVLGEQIDDGYGSLTHGSLKQTVVFR